MRLIDRLIRHQQSTVRTLTLIRRKAMPRCRDAISDMSADGPMCGHFISDDILPLGILERCRGTEEPRRLGIYNYTSPCCGMQEPTTIQPVLFRAADLT